MIVVISRPGGSLADPRMKVILAGGFPSGIPSGDPRGRRNYVIC